MLQPPYAYTLPRLRNDGLQYTGMISLPSRDDRYFYFDSPSRNLRREASLQTKTIIISRSIVKLLQIESNNTGITFPILVSFNSLKQCLLSVPSRSIRYLLVKYLTSLKKYGLRFTLSPQHKTPFLARMRNEPAKRSTIDALFSLDI